MEGRDMETKKRDTSNMRHKPQWEGSMDPAVDRRVGTLRHIPHPVVVVVVEHLRTRARESEAVESVPIRAKRHRRGDLVPPNMRSKEKEGEKRTILQWQ